MPLRGFIADLVGNSTYQDHRMLNQTSLVSPYSSYNNWANHYDLIYVANVILDNLHRAEGVSKDKLDFYAGQAYFVKGFVYFDLARKWGEAVITKNSTSMLRKDTNYCRNTRICLFWEQIRGCRNNTGAKEVVRRCWRICTRGKEV